MPPIVAVADVGGSTVPKAVSISTGTSTAMAFTANPDKVSLATFVCAASCAGESTRERTFNVSPSPARSAKNGSSAVAANTCTPAPRSYTAALKSAW